MTVHYDDPLQTKLEQSRRYKQAKKEAAATNSQHQPHPPYPVSYTP
ncbi:hypothetical protein VTP01DRAFT_10717 [Rhizomucor pusillus]